MPSTPFYPVPVFHFQLEWGGTRIGFTEVTGFNQEHQPIEYREGVDPNYFPSKIPGLRKFGNITMKRGYGVGDNQFYEWLNATNLDKPDRRTLTMKLLDETHAPIFTWTLNNAWPSKLEGASFKSTGNEIAMESLEICVESWTMEASA